MSSERWERVKRLVDEALSLDGNQRAAFLSETCGDDAGLRAEVESLLAHQGRGPLESGVTADPDLAGTVLGRYEVIGEIGRGGMGRVYRALDATLERHVAIKVLPRRFVADPERLRRFEREARLAASLSHPGIAAVHGLERAGDTPFLVLELIEGRTLRQRMDQGRLSVAEALEVARQIAEALEAAHEKGVVHRDLKPSNVALTDEGAVKILDFGLAKAMVAGASDEDGGRASETDTPTTREGVLIGTPPYMSPEQVDGVRVDHRTDVWSFGVVLWEMLVAARPFAGDTTSEVLAAVLRDEPNWRRLPPATPPRVVSLLRRCLTRDRRRRLQAIGEARILIEAPEPGETAAAPSLWRRLAIATAAVLATTAIALALRSGAGQPDREVAVLGALLPPPGSRLDALSGFALSPDGSRLAFVAEDEADGVLKLWVRHLSAEGGRSLPDTDGAYLPFWSPDGTRLAFFAGGRLKSTPSDGGPVQTVAEAPDVPRGGAWSTHGQIVYSPSSRSGLVSVPAGGGDPTPLTALDEGELSHRWPRYLPDGRLLMLVQTAEPGAPDDRSRLEIVGPDGNRRELLRVNSSGLVAAQHLLFWREGALRARPLDTSTLRFRGEARILAEDVGFDINERMAVTAAPPATLVYHGDYDPPRRFVLVDANGGRQVLAVREGEFDDPSVAPDGRIAYVEGDATIWVLDPQRGTRTRMTFEAIDHYSPTWSPDGSWLAYAADASDGPGGRIYRQPESGLGGRELLYSSDQLLYGTHWSPRGRWIAFDEAGDIMLLDVDTGRARPLIETERLEIQPRISPDGRFLAYSSDESGRLEVYVVRTTGEAGRWRISRDGGRQPRWDPSGRWLAFLGLDGAIRWASGDLGAEPHFGIPHSTAPGSGGAIRAAAFDFTPSGGLALLVGRDSVRPAAFHLLLNWPEVLGAGPS